jgi:hypothetical protein
MIMHTIFSKGLLNSTILLRAFLIRNRTSET